MLRSLMRGTTVAFIDATLPCLPVPYRRGVTEYDRPDIENIEQRIALLLNDSSALLPTDSDTEWYREVMETEQFELALDELVRLGDEHRPPFGYWNNLTAVASLIGQPERIAGLRSRAEG